VTRSDGSVLVYETNRVKGDPFEGFEVTDTELDAKFLRYTEGRLDETTAREAIGFLRQLDRQPSVTPLGELVSRTG
jgi:hypothetical protein